MTHLLVSIRALLLSIDEKIVKRDLLEDIKEHLHNIDRVGWDEKGMHEGVDEGRGERTPRTPRSPTLIPSITVGW